MRVNGFYLIHNAAYKQTSRRVSGVTWQNGGVAITPLAVYRNL